jgi:hypothetical protein
VLGNLVLVEVPGREIRAESNEKEERKQTTKKLPGSCGYVHSCTSFFTSTDSTFSAASFEALGFLDGLELLSLLAIEYKIKHSVRMLLYVSVLKLI